jgi:hypothetical protein
MWNQKSNKRQTSQGLNPHLTGSTGIENKRGRRKNGTYTLSTNSSWNWFRLEEKRDGTTILNQLALLHDLGAESAQDCPYGP